MEANRSLIIMHRPNVVNFTPSHEDVKLGTIEEARVLTIDSREWHCEMIKMLFQDEFSSSQSSYFHFFFTSPS